MNQILANLNLAHNINGIKTVNADLVKNENKPDDFKITLKKTRTIDN